MNKLKLHLGCGQVILPGFVNMDARPLAGVDVLTDVFMLPSVQPESVDLIYASHVFEHVPRPLTEHVLGNWYKVLMPGGVLRLAVPNFESVVLEYVCGKPLTDLLGLLYGRQDYPGNAHMCAYDFDTLSALLTKCKFTDVKPYDWRKTEHASHDDYSRSHLPHDPEAIKSGAFTHHRLMSLNVEAVKPK